MYSSFYYPINAGSLGEPRRTHTWTGIDHRTSAHFEVRGSQTRATKAKPTILVVEDDSDSLYVLKNILSTKGYRVLEASDGEEALVVVETRKLNLILLDLQLPKLDGFGVIRRLRANANFENLPIVMMTACEPEKFRGTAIAAGCYDFLPKPLDFDLLDAVLDQLVPLRPGPFEDSPKY
jgi:two-component system, OmpR family, phosphate regulon response regulator PhoB